MKNLEIMKNGKKNKKLEKIKKTTNVWKLQNHENWKKCKMQEAENYKCNWEHFSVKNLPRNLLKEPGPPIQMR